VIAYYVKALWSYTRFFGKSFKKKDPNWGLLEFHRFGNYSPGASVVVVVVGSSAGTGAAVVVVVNSGRVVVG
jgi:molybdopterin synthase catalytic subunit